MDVKFLPEVHIERAANELLAGYGGKFGELTAPPVPADQILECHLGLSLDFNDLCARFGKPDILGAIWVEDQEVLIDQSLDPDEHPGREGRFRFTVAHETGHWALHRHQLIEARSAGLFAGKQEPSVVCRDLPRKKKPPIEWQADCFAAYLLMPEVMVRRCWTEVAGSPEPYVAEDELAELVERFGTPEGELPTIDLARRMADYFKVSGQAMQIRLLGLKLILEKQPPPGLFG